ncbi:MAG: manganese efflux pump MntP family protein [Peptococcaceae bacterium]|nr:manganese efflux pump MntP family protein [Peptococcaceae bacterium]
MDWSLMFFVNSVLLGIGLAMDAFSVSIANGLNEPRMRFGRMSLIAGTFAFFQWFMPMAGWICVHTIVQYFRAFEKAIPWIALVLLLFIGGKMIFEALHDHDENDIQPGSGGVGAGALVMQGIATSIDALSVGFTIASYNALMAFVCAVLIAVVTFFICMGGLKIGKTVGDKFSNKAAIFGGAILIFIGIEIWVTGVLI